MPYLCTKKGIGLQYLLKTILLNIERMVTCRVYQKLIVRNYYNRFVLIG